MPKKKQSELTELNTKLDVLISLMTQQVQQQKPSIEVKESVVVPEKKKRGRPKKVQIEIRKTTRFPVVQPSSPPIEKEVSLFVSPEMTINGEKYLGPVKVKASTAVQLRRMMQDWEKYERRTQQFIDHGTRDHGVIQ